MSGTPRICISWGSDELICRRDEDDFATLLDAQRQIRQARQNQIKAQVDAQVRLAEIERLLGEEL